MKRSSKPDIEETHRDDGVVQGEPIIVDHPSKPDPKLLNTVLKVNNYSIEHCFIRQSSFSLGCGNEIQISRSFITTSTKYSCIVLLGNDRHSHM